MLETIVIILSISILTLLLIQVIYDLVYDIKNKRDFEKYKKKQWETLNKLIEREEN